MDSDEEMDENVHKDFIKQQDSEIPSDTSMWLPIPRKLNFSPQPEDKNLSLNPINNASPVKISPPCRNLLTLRLTENPSTPNTIYLNSGRRVIQTNKLTGRLSAPNMNPFTPESMLRLSKKRSRCLSSRDSKNMQKEANILNNNVSNKDNEYSGEIDSDIDEQPAKRFAIIESNSGLSRYLTEFEQRSLLGTGEFGCVYKCTNRMDGCDYAIKKSSKTIAGSANERKALNEVFAHAVLGKHENVVRYFTAWVEDKHMLIQNEFCNGGSLQDAIEKHRTNGTCFSESEVRLILLHVAEGLRYIHSHNLVHMDIKPGNIFISREPRVRPLHYDADDSFEEDSHTTYKIGDLGHVTSIANVPDGVEEGDTRYLAKEVFHDDYRDLTKADIFALGLTVYEAAGGGPLKKNGPEWHEIREGKIPDLQHCSKELNDLIKQMTHSDPEKRPTAFQILKHNALCSSSNKTKEQLERELQAEKTKTQILEKRLKAFSSLFKTKMLSRNVVMGTEGVRTRSNSRIVGKNVNRSHSTTEFGW